MNKRLLRKIIEQYVSNMYEDSLVDPADVGPNAAYTLPGNDYDEEQCEICGMSPCTCDHSKDVCPSCGQSPCVCNRQSPYSLSCDECGSVMVMQESCGCSGNSSNWSNFEIMSMPIDSFSNQYDQNFDSDDYEQYDYDDHEENEHEHAHEGAYMAKPQLHQLEDYARKLQSMIPDDSNLDDWMRSHISQAIDDITEVYQSLESKMHSSED